MIRKENRLLKAYDKCLKARNSFLAAQENLTKVASEFLGEDIIAEICGGGEVEFRRVKGKGADRYVDDYDTFRIEDLIKK